MGSDTFTPVGDAVAGDRGGVREAVTPEVTTRYRWHYAGDTDARPSNSGVVRVRVRTPQHPPFRINTSPRSAPCTTSCGPTGPTWSGAVCAPGACRCGTGR